MDPVLFEFGAFLAAFALILYSVVSCITGAAFVSGAAVREAIEPSLRSFRDSSSVKRQDLADRSVLVGGALAMVSLFTGGGFISGILALVLWWSRPQIKKLTSSEHPLMALGSQFSGDLVVGIAVPLGLAHLLLGSVFLALSSASIVVALSWPTGGPGRRDGAWKPSWVGA